MEDQRRDATFALSLPRYGEYAAKKQGPAELVLLFPAFLLWFLVALLR